MIVPRNLLAVTLMWDAVDGAAKYRIYCAEQPTHIVAGENYLVEVTDTEYEPNETYLGYWFAATALDDYGNESELTDIIKWTSGGSILISWKPGFLKTVFGAKRFGSGYGAGVQ